MYKAAKTLEIDTEDVGRRLDNYLLSIFKNTPKSYVYRIIRSGEVRVNGGRKKAHTRLKLADNVRIPPFRESTQAAPVISSQWQQSVLDNILYEDESVLVLNKPAGLSVHGGTGQSFGIIDIVQKEYGARVELAHRLDKDTTGCLLLGKSPIAARELHRQFREGDVRKRYRTLLRGHLENADTVVQARLTTQRKDVGEAKTRVDEQGKEAKSIFTIVETLGDLGLACTYADVAIETGRTHQIRVHAAHIGHPVAGDRRYGDSAFNDAMTQIGLSTLSLHSASLAFIHPKTSRTVVVEACIPKEMLRLVNTLAETMS